LSDEPVHLPAAILRSSRAEAPSPRLAPLPPRGEAAAFTVGRRTDNELILFDQAASESWIVYPPRSAYEFLRMRRRSASTTVVEHHPWSAFVSPVDHLIDARNGCLEHGLDCPAQAAIAAVVRLGYDPFA
jgi:hypothetical protein